LDEILGLFEKFTTFIGFYKTAEAADFNYYWHKTTQFVTMNGEIISCSKMN
jgi:hypothetical protein